MAADSKSYCMQRGLTFKLLHKDSKLEDKVYYSLNTNKCLWSDV